MTSEAELDIKDAIATRQFDLKDGRKVHAYFWKPVYFPDDPDQGTYEYYRCPTRMIGIGRDKTYCAEGVDSVQAFMLALNMVATRLYYSEAYETGDLTYLGGRDLWLSLSDGRSADRQGYEKADLLTAPSYMTIVQLPDQKFAGIYFSGDHLNQLNGQLAEICQIIDGEAHDALAPVVAGLASTLKYYEAVSAKAGLHLPYVKGD